MTGKPSEGVPPVVAEGEEEESVAGLKATGEQQLRDGLFMEAVKTLTTALDRVQSAGGTDEALEKLQADAMQKAALVRMQRCLYQLGA